MEIVIILSHLMSKEGVLDHETLKRIDKGIQICIQRKCPFLISSGWAYRDDSSLAIGQVVANYIKKNFHLENCKIIFDTNSRDTVGDAYFIRKKISNLKLSKLIIITSDYHVFRTNKIFEKFFSSLPIEMIGVKTNFSKTNKIVENEKISLSMFKKTFNKIDFRNDFEVYKVLREKHPYYNGKVFSKI